MDSTEVIKSFLRNHTGLKGTNVVLAKVLLGTVEVLQRFSRIPFWFGQGFLGYHLGLTKVF